MQGHIEYRPSALSHDAHWTHFFTFWIHPNLTPILCSSKVLIILCTYSLLPCILCCWSACCYCSPCCYCSMCCFTSILGSSDCKSSIVFSRFWIALSLWRSFSCKFKAITSSTNINVAKCKPEGLKASDYWASRSKPTLVNSVAPCIYWGECEWAHSYGLNGPHHHIYIWEWTQEHNLFTHCWLCVKACYWWIWGTSINGVPIEAPTDGASLPPPPDAYRGQSTQSSHQLVLRKILEWFCQLTCSGDLTIFLSYPGLTKCLGGFFHLSEMFMLNDVSTSHLSGLNSYTAHLCGVHSF